MTRFRLATFNLRFVLDRWAERRKHCTRCLADVRADVVCAQEVAVAGFFGRAFRRGQLDRLTADLNALRPHKTFTHVAHAEPAEYIKSGFGSLPYWVSLLLFDWNPLWHIFIFFAALFNEQFLERIFGRHMMAVFEHPAGAIAFVGLGTAFIFGKATLIEKDLLPKPAPENDVLCLGSFRTAQRVRIADHNSGTSSWIVNVHLKSGRSPADEAYRLKQLQDVMSWMVPVIAQADALIVCGDFNANPSESGYAFMLERGFTSCFLTRHGKEPSCTFPGIGQGLQASSKDNDPAGTFDFIFIAGDIDLAKDGEVKLFANSPCDGDDTLYPSDHFGLVADLHLGAHPDKEAAKRALLSTMTK